MGSRFDPGPESWKRATLQKLMDCEAAAPIIQRASLKATNVATNIWYSLKDSLPMILLPPGALLIMGCIFGWITRGFRSSA